ncbi:MAG TPA: hypothetical protein VFG19_10730 [Geobacteraceae bacterium]|nr:hypothetical protein [Geobacteraceae bacterium]
MKCLILAVAIVIAASGTTFANWQVYREDKSIVASVDYLSRASFRGKPSVWVRWHFKQPRKGIGGVKIQFTADCARRNLYEIAYIPYDTKGNYLTPSENYDSPKQYTVTPHSLNEATYRLLCR